MTYRRYVIIAIFLLGFFKMKAEAIPFKLVGKSILIEASVNGISGHFILDTGTPNLILNSQYFKGIPTGKKMVGLVGKQVDIYRNEAKLSIGDYTWKRIDATILPLQHLSKSKGKTILGLIGNSVLNRFRMAIDFDVQELELIKTSRQSRLETEDLFPDVSFSFLWRGGIPVIKTRVGNRSLFFGFDTGAGINVLNTNRAKDLANHLSIGHKVSVAGVGKGWQSLESGLINDVNIDNYYCPAMQVVLVSMERFKGFDSQLNSIDGFLGYEFLQHFRTVIDFKKRTISLYYRNDFARTYIISRG